MAPCDVHNRVWILLLLKAFVLLMIATTRWTTQVRLTDTQEFATRLLRRYKATHRIRGHLRQLVNFRVYTFVFRFLSPSSEHRVTVA